MPGVLIRNVPAADLVLLDEHAARLRISRTDYLRRHLRREARQTTAPGASRHIEVWADRVERGLTRITTLTLLEAG